MSGRIVAILTVVAGVEVGIPEGGRGTVAFVGDRDLDGWRDGVLSAVVEDDATAFGGGPVELRGVGVMVRRVGSMRLEGEAPREEGRLLAGDPRWAGRFNV